MFLDSRFAYPKGGNPLEKLRILGQGICFLNKHDDNIHHELNSWYLDRSLDHPGSVTRLAILEHTYPNDYSPKKVSITKEKREERKHQSSMKTTLRKEKHSRSRSTSHTTSFQNSTNPLHNYTVTLE